MSSTTNAESNSPVEVNPPPSGEKTAPPPLATLCSESLGTKDQVPPVIPHTDGMVEVVAKQENETKVENKQDENVKQSEQPEAEIKQNEGSEGSIANIEEQKASELGNTVGAPSTTEPVATKESSADNQNSPEQVPPLGDDKATVNGESEKPDKPIIIENADKNEQIKETNSETTQETAPTNEATDTETKNEDVQEEEDCVNIQELTAHVMSILNEGIAEENSNREELMKKNLDLQQFIVKLIHLLKEKTDLCSNLDRQNTALTCQAKSLKDVIAITKDLLGIRNLEVERLHSDLNSMEEQIKGERNRHSTAVQHLNEAMGLNSKLKAEYLTQMDLFQKLKDKYTEKVVLLTKENIRLKNLLEESGISVTPQVNGNPPQNTVAPAQSESIEK